jgi:hypothetical protein
MNYRLKKIALVNDYEVMLVNLARRQKVSIEYLQTHNMHNDLYNGITFHSKNLGTYALIKARLRNRVNTLLNELKYE